MYASDDILFRSYDELASGSGLGTKNRRTPGQLRAFLDSQLSELDANRPTALPPASARSYSKLKHVASEEEAFRFGVYCMTVASLTLTKRKFDSAKYTQKCRDLGIPLAIHEEGNNEGGGFLVPQEFDNTMIVLREKYGVFRRNARVRPMTSDTSSRLRRKTGLTAFFVGEGNAGTESSKSYDRVGLVAKKLMILSRMTTELSEDALINVGDDLAGEIAYAFSQKEDDCGFNGDGSSTYGGIWGVCPKLKGLDSTIANIAGLFVGSGNAYSELQLADFNSVVALLPEYVDARFAKWYVSKKFYESS